MNTASYFLGLYSGRLERNDRGLTGPWAPELRTGIEGLVQKLRALPPSQAIEVSHDQVSGIARFTVQETGELIGAFPLPEVNQ